MAGRPFVAESQGYRKAEIVKNWNKQIGFGLPVFYKGKLTFCKGDAFFNDFGCFVRICGEAKAVPLTSVIVKETTYDDEEGA